MTKVYSVGMTIEMYEPIYVAADSREQAFDAVTEFLRSQKGQDYVNSKMEIFGRLHLFHTVRSDYVAEMNDNWPADMVTIDATKKEESA